MHQERCARRVAWEFGEHIFKLKNSDNATFYAGIEIGMPAPTSTRPEEREFVVKELSSEEMGTVKRSRNPTVVLTANGLSLIHI